MDFLKLVFPVLSTVLGACLVWFLAPSVEKRKINHARKFSREMMYEEVGEVEYFFRRALENVCDFHEMLVLARHRLGSPNVLEYFPSPLEYETKFLYDKFQECYGVLSPQEKRALRAIISCLADYNKKIGKLDREKSIYDLSLDYPSVSLVYAVCSILFLSEKLRSERERYQGCADIDVNDSVLRAYGRVIDESWIKHSSKFLK